MDNELKIIVDTLELVVMVNERLVNEIKTLEERVSLLEKPSYQYKMRYK